VLLLLHDFVNHVTAHKGKLHAAAACIGSCLILDITHRFAAAA
jgi:hypothetical protein